jgi:hypothetical protein
MNVIPTQNTWFDDAATSAMGEAFDNACKSLQNFGSDGERDPVRLYEQALIFFGIDDASKLARVGRDLPVSAYTSVAQAA